MKLCNSTCQIRHRQVRHATNNNDATGVGKPVALAPRSALAVPDDSLDSIMQCLGEENRLAVRTNGCTAGAWLDEFFDGGMNISTCAGAEGLVEMLLDLPDTAALDAEAAETATRAEAAAVPDRPAVAMLSSTSLSSSDDDMNEDDDHWVSSSDSSSEDDAADAHWLPSKSKKRGGTKRRPRQQNSTLAGQRKQQPESVVPSAPHGVVVAGEGRSGGIDRWCRHCGTVETPLWRAGPEGAKTLCNACGLRCKNKSAALTTKRRPAAKPSLAESKNQSVLRLVGDATVTRKKRSVTIRGDRLKQ